METDSVPLETSCLSCKRYFLLSEKLPLESMTVQFKNYSFPIKESFLKQILLKTIVAFLNSKGGTIFMGIDDSNGEVVGLTLGRRDMDEFKLMIKHMLEKVQPMVDLVKSQEVSVEFVPVLQGRERFFYGRYVIKFIVLQGDPSKLYCISQKAMVSGNKLQEVQVICCFRRHNMGGIEEIKGIKVIHEIYQKARNPYKLFKTFHQNCNPQPIYPMILQRPKKQKPQSMFVREETPESNGLNKSHVSNSSRGVSQSGTIIDKIKQAEKSHVPQTKKVLENANKFKIQAQGEYCLYFQNVKRDNLKSLANFLKNSTTAKQSKQVCVFEQLVVVKFFTRSDKQSFIVQLENSKIRGLVNSFGIQQKVYVVSFPNLKGSRVTPLQKEIILNQQVKQEAKTEKYEFSILFKDCLERYEASLQNYVQKCMTSNIYRKMNRSRRGLELAFKNKRDMNLFYQMCIKPPHSRQLSKYGVNGNLRIKIHKKQENQIAGSQNFQTLGPRQQKPKAKIQEKDFPSILYQQVLRTQLENEIESETNGDALQIIASSLQPSEVLKLTNYMTNNMFYNIQKKILASIERFYIRLIFNSPGDCKKFLELCLEEPHKRLLPQFSGTKTLRIGVPGDSLLIHPYNEAIKDELKKKILNFLGQGVIKKSTVKNVSQNSKVWALRLVETDKILEYYEKLEKYFRNETFFINQEYVKFRVFLDYKNLSD